MPNSASSQPLFLYSTSVSDVGTVRSNNQDSSFAGERLVAICDGMGGHAGGDTASTIAIRSLAHIEKDDMGGDVEAVSSMLETSIMAAHDAIVGKAKRERSLAGMGTTVTSLALVSGWWVLAHIGDSRAYLLRQGKLTRMTSDHSYVQHLIDTDRITESEGRNHPQRNVVMRVLGDFDIDPRPDIAIRKAHPADRWLLCSDGLCGVLEDSTIEETLSTVADQGQCAQELVSMALKAGSTDNVTAVIADATLALDADAFDIPHQTPLVGGAASASLEAIADIINEPVASAPALVEGKNSPAQRAAALTQYPDDDQPVSRLAQPSAVREETGEKITVDTGEIPVVQKENGRISADPNDPEVAQVIHHKQEEKHQAARKRKRRRRLWVLTGILALLLALSSGAFGAYHWSQSKYYLGNGDGYVTIYQGVNTNLFGAGLSHQVERTSISISSLPQSWRDQLDEGIAVDSLTEARSHAKLIQREGKRLKQAEKKSQVKDKEARGSKDKPAPTDTAAPTTPATPTETEHPSDPASTQQGGQS
ncbi:phosphoprotein phosphatase [Bifidobacterium aemilianum]|uniref:Phosphoprotein phosphatase n=1 Tax=Bifidobacterium aemilianum TaxID=2493120 RepID=A0A366K986_9BIFI|nr:protein phosphatase 2C domain-containing protein [Bifidobacterium aemilianum]RBP97802.1 phosphoprotein phosphatase [Bifidobacterium aemilianum]